MKNLSMAAILAAGIFWFSANTSWGQSGLDQKIWKLPAGMSANKPEEESRGKRAESAVKSLKQPRRLYDLRWLLIPVGPLMLAAFLEHRRKASKRQRALAGNLRGVGWLLMIGSLAVGTAHGILWLHLGILVLMSWMMKRTNEVGPKKFFGPIWHWFCESSGPSHRPPQCLVDAYRIYCRKEK